MLAFSAGSTQTHTHTHFSGCPHNFLIIDVNKSLIDLLFFIFYFLDLAQTCFVLNLSLATRSVLYNNHVRPLWSDVLGVNGPIQAALHL